MSDVDVDVTTETTGSKPPKEVSNALIFESLHDMRDELRELRDDFDAFKKRVEGSNPPKNGGGESLAQQAARGSSASFDVDELRGAMLAMRSEIDKQSRAMGLSGVLEWFSSPNATAKVARIVGVIGTVYTALHACGVIK